MPTIHLTVDETLIEQLDHIGETQHRSRDAVLSEAIAAYIKQQKRQETTATENDPLLSLVATVTATIPAEVAAQMPKDLARNYKHSLYGATKE